MILLIVHPFSSQGRNVKNNTVKNKHYYLPTYNHWEQCVNNKHILQSGFFSPLNHLKITYTYQVPLLSMHFLSTKTSIEIQKMLISHNIVIFVKDLFIYFWLGWGFIAACGLSLQSCPNICNLMDSPWNSPGQNIGVGSCSLLQGIFPTQGSNPGLLHLQPWTSWTSMISTASVNVEGTSI